MTGFAAERRVYLVMADQAVGHLRKDRRADGTRLLQPAMACGASILSIQVPPDVTGVREVLFCVNCLRNRWR